jgi:glycosyltransferase involved in cell wall biosynthesis
MAARPDSASAPFGYMSVVHVTEAPLGGVVAYLEEVLRAQGKLGLRSLDLVTPQGNIAALPDVAGPVRFIPFQHSRRSLDAPFRLAWTAIRHARATRPDILHVHSTIAGVLVRFCRRLLPRMTHVVYCPHGWAFSREGNRLMARIVMLFERFLSRRCEKIICISQFERQEAIRIGISPARLVVIENGITLRHASTPRTAFAAGERKTIAFIGRFDRQKGFDTFLAVLRRLGSSAQGVAIGDALVSKGDLPDLPDNLVRLGWQPRSRIFELYQTVDLLIVPSRWEGFGLVAIEAMQARLAVFASRVGGLQDIVVDGETGRLFEPDDVEAIAELVRSTDHETLRFFGENGYVRYLKRYTAERMNQRIMDLYAELAGSDHTMQGRPDIVRPGKI